MRTRLQPTADAAARAASHPPRHDGALARELDAGPAAGEPQAAAVSNRALSQAWAQGAPAERDAGVPLEPALRADMEARFGENFADVRVHDDAHAHRSAAALQASAYTVGGHVVFSRDRFAPQAAPGRRLLAHELAHVVQQRRGGAAPPLSPHAAHEAAAEQAATQVAAGATAVPVAGGTAVGVARDRETDPQRLAEGASDAAPMCHAPTPYPLEDAFTRGIEPGPRYWLSHEPDVAHMKPHRLDDEANQIDEWIARQTTSSRDDARLLEVRNRLRAEAGAREHRASRPTPRRKKGKQAQAAGAVESGGTDTRPRFLRKRSSIGSSDPAALAAEYDELLSYAQDDKVPKEERELVQLELANLRPAMRDELARRSNQRHAEAIGNALTPDAAWDVRSHLSGAAQRIDSIRALPHHPGYSYVMHGSEMLVMSDEQVAAVRDSMIKTMSGQTVGTHHDTEQVQQEWHDFVKLNFEEHKYVGFFTMLWSGENPSEWDVLLMPHVIESNQRIGRFKSLRAQAQDPWRTGPAPLLPMAEAVGIAEHHAGLARTVLDYRIGKMMTAAGEIVSGLDRVRMAGQFAAAIAFSPAGGALYGGVSSTAVQLSEMAHGQRDSLDPLAIGFDAAAGYVGAKVTRGVMGFGGKAAPLWQRGALFVLGDRAGASAGVGTRMALDKVSGRKNYSLSQIGGAMADQATDAKQMLINMALARAGKFVEARSRPVPAPKRTNDANDAPKPAADDATATPKAIADEAAAVKPATEEPAALKPTAEEATAPKPATDEPAALKPAADEPAVTPRNAGSDAKAAPLADTVEARLSALDVPPGQRKAFDKAAKLMRQRALTDPDSAQEMLQGLERRFGAAAPLSKGEQLGEEFDAASGKLYPEKTPTGKYTQSPAADQRAVHEQRRPSPKESLKASVKESERRGVGGGEEQAAREGIAVHDWDTPQKWKGEYGQGPDALGTRGDRELILEFKGGSSPLGVSQRTGVVEMSNAWAGRKIAELEFVGDTATAARLLKAAQEGRLQGAVYRTRELVGGEKISRLKAHQLRDRLVNEAIRPSGLIEYSPRKVEAAYRQRMAELADAAARGDVRNLP